MKYRRYTKIIAFLMAIVLVILPITTEKNANAAVKKYGIVVTDRYGNNTFYDLNSSTDGSAII